MYKMSLCIATYNRIPYIKKMLMSLQSSNNFSRLNIRIYDDCSSTITREKLQSLFPFAKEIIIRKNNFGADQHSRQIYEDFLNSEDDILINGDSDLIYRPDWLSAIEKYLPQTDGVLSLYNSNKHSCLPTPPPPSIGPEYIFIF